MLKAATTYLKATNSQKKRSFKTLKSVRSLYNKTSVYVGMTLIDEYSRNKENCHSEKPSTNFARRSFHGHVRFYLEWIDSVCTMMYV